MSEKINAFTATIYDGRDVSDPIVGNFLTECYRRFIQFIDKYWPNAVYPTTSEESKGWIISSQSLGIDNYEVKVYHKFDDVYTFNLFMSDVCVSNHVFKTMDEFIEILFNVDLYVTNMLNGSIFEVAPYIDDIPLYAIYKVVCDKINESHPGIAEIKIGGQSGVIRTVKNENILNYWITKNFILVKSDISNLYKSPRDIGDLTSSQAIDYLYVAIMSDIEPPENEKQNPNETLMASEFDRLTLLDAFGHEIEINDKTSFTSFEYLKIKYVSDTTTRQTHLTTSEYLAYIYLKNGYKFTTPLFASDLSDSLSIKKVTTELYNILKGKLVILKNGHVESIDHNKKIVSNNAYVWNDMMIH